MWLTGGAAAEFQCDDRWDITGALCKRRVLQQQLVVLLAGQFDLGINPLTGQRCLDDRLYARLDPVRQAMSNRLRPFIGSAAAGGEIAAVSDQVRNELSDVTGEVDIL